MENTESKVGKVYELGYLLLPSIPTEKVEAEVEVIKTLITKNGGTFIADEFPKLRPLAYTMQKKVGSTRHKVDEAYFGWVKFETNPEAMSPLKLALDANDQVLRYLLINTVRENTYLGQKAAVIAKDAKEEVKTEDAPAVVEDTSTEEIDKTIDDMVKEA